MELGFIYSSIGRQIDKLNEFFLKRETIHIYHIYGENSNKKLVHFEVNKKGERRNCLRCRLGPLERCLDIKFLSGGEETDTETRMIGTFLMSVKNA